MVAFTGLVNWLPTLNSMMRTHSRKANSSLSFSNRDLHSEEVISKGEAGIAAESCCPSPAHSSKPQKRHNGG
eukprot:1158917-Pelagomonas_calceolata.AAC.3